MANTEFQRNYRILSEYQVEFRSRHGYSGRWGSSGAASSQSEVSFNLNRLLKVEAKRQRKMARALNASVLEL